ncbi:MAG TPA: hypothetical protein VJR92_11030 [Gemmatimonadaceae bacterium]|nr:hypothetical protein [Gemmatimonadaceae bacterium]
MYTTCLYCNSQFEKNESIEAFPVGRRLAFDAAKGRLWVVCRKCERWCLSPLDERWEAIEQAEKLFRDTRTRVSTDNIGLAKVAEGTTLVRIGNPLRPEFAAWRYGDQFGRRRRKQMLISGGAAVAVGGLVVGELSGFGLGTLWIFGQNLQFLLPGAPQRIVARIRDSRDGILIVRRRDLSETFISRTPTGTMTLDVRYSHARDEDHWFTTQFQGAEARRVAAQLLPKANRFGGNKKQVAEAVGMIEQVGSASRFVEYVCETAPASSSPKDRSFWTLEPPSKPATGLLAIPAPQRLALEMALHEESERRALEGELAQLEKAWRDAEEIAGISDNLTVPASVATELERMKRP